MNVRRVRQNVRQSFKDDGRISEADVQRAIDITIELMKADVPLVDAVLAASQQITREVLDRELKALEAHEDRLYEERERRRKEREAQFEKERAALIAKATPGQRPTLKATLGDLLSSKKVNHER